MSGKLAGMDPDLFEDQEPSKLPLVKRILEQLNTLPIEKPGEHFFLTSDEVIELCSMAVDTFRRESSLLQIDAPIKIFGDIHGQWNDLQAIFESYGYPNFQATGDLNRYNYLFLGDFVDRGNRSLEVLCLLLALKIEHPGKVHMIRGNHETNTMNIYYGFHDEIRCRIQCKEYGMRKYKKIIQGFDNVFDMLPLGAVVGGKILCVHGGIGKIQTLEQIEAIQRPTPAPTSGEDVHTKQDEVLVDLLWSDPAEDDACKGFKPNQRGVSVTFGADVVRDFLKNNNLEIIVRAHQVVLDGYEYFAGGRCITLFSATKYCGMMENSGAILCVDENLKILPKVIYPFEHEQAWKQMGSPPTPMRKQHKRSNSWQDRPRSFDFPKQDS